MPVMNAQRQHACQPMNTARQANHTPSAGSKTIQDLRLVNNFAPAGSPVLEGRVEVKVAGRRGIVCDAWPDPATAAAFCRQLGFNGEGAQATHDIAYVETPTAKDLPGLLTTVSCPGQVESLEACEIRGAAPQLVPVGELERPGCGGITLALKCQPLPAPPA